MPIGCRGWWPQVSSSLKCLLIWQAAFFVHTVNENQRFQWLEHWPGQTLVVWERLMAEEQGGLVAAGGPASPSYWLFCLCLTAAPWARCGNPQVGTCHWSGGASLTAQPQTEGLLPNHAFPTANVALWPPGLYSLCRVSAQLEWAPWRHSPFVFSLVVIIPSASRNSAITSQALLLQDWLQIFSSSSSQTFFGFFWREGNWV